MILLILAGLVLLGLGFVAFIINAQIALSQNMIKPEPVPGVSEWFSPALIAIYVAVGIFLSEQAYVRWKDNKANNERIINTYNAIINEIKDHEKTLSSEKRVKDGDGIDYADAFFNHGAYDSIVHSGYLTLIKNVELQQAIVNLYLRVNVCNQYIFYIDQYNDTFSINKLSSEQQKRWENQIRERKKLVTRNQQQMSDLMGGIEVEMNKLIKKSSEL